MAGMIFGEVPKLEEVLVSIEQVEQAVNRVMVAENLVNKGKSA